MVARDGICIGARTKIAEYVSFRDQDYVFESSLPLNLSGTTSKEIVIGADVWLGAKVTFLKGTSLGNKFVVGAGSVVKKYFIDNVLIAEVTVVIIMNVRFYLDIDEKYIY